MFIFLLWAFECPDFFFFKKCFTSKFERVTNLVGKVWQPGGFIIGEVKL